MPKGARKPKKPARKAATRGGKTAAKTAVPIAVPQVHGGALLSGGVPGNPGGRAGRSGRKPDEFKKELAAIRDADGLDVLRQVLSGEVRYTLRGVCQHCKKVSDGPSDKELASLYPSPQVRLHASEITMKYTVGLEKTLLIEGADNVRNAFEVIKSRIRAVLTPDVASGLIDDIYRSLMSP